jgi:DNA repair protein RadC
MKSLHDKLMARGAVALSDAELLALLLESSAAGGDSLATAAALLGQYGSLAGVASCGLSRLRMAEGIGLKRAERLHLAAEFGRRVTAAINQNAESITSDEDVVRLMRPVVDGMKHEECWVIYLTNSNRILDKQRVSQGGVQATVVDHRLIVKRALELLAVNIILVHNHPSGSVEPSQPDKILTRKVKEAAALFEISLLDHIIISSEGSYSFRRNGIL